MALLRKEVKEKDIQLADKYGLFQQLFKKKWVVYAKRPFAKPQNVIEYLGRYSHKIAISNHRITAIEGDKVSFSYKDYRDNGNRKKMTLSHREFIRRYSMHILASGFQCIRHYDFLASCHKRRNLEMARKSLKKQGKLLSFIPITQAELKSKTWQTIAHERLGFDARRCPNCGTPTMIKIDTIAPKWDNIYGLKPSSELNDLRAPPQMLKKLKKS